MTDLRGEWEIELADGRGKKNGFLPGTLDENKLGDEDRVAKAWHPDVEDRNEKLEESAGKDSRIATRLTRNYTYEGAAKFRRKLSVRPSGKRQFVVAERARAMSLSINGVDAPCIKRGLSTPYVFEVTNLLTPDCILEITTDNTYPGMPYRDITFSSAATDETQTNWNGVIGGLYLEEKDEAFITGVRIYPSMAGASGNAVVDVVVEISYESAATSAEGASDRQASDKRTSDKVIIEKVESDDAASQKEVTITLHGDSLTGKTEITATLHQGLNTINLKGIRLTEEACARKWDEEEGNLHELTCVLEDAGKELDSVKERFGIRFFSYDKEGRLTLNGRRIFLRSEANCGLFPEEGHPPMDKGAWTEILKTYASYGVNCVRFHSWCPPKACFEAADELGMMVQPELPNWNPRNAFGDREACEFYENELPEILKCYANHPSFVMLTMGNELHGDETSVEEMHRLISMAKEIDDTRLFSWGSNNFYGEKGPDGNSDFYTASNNREDVLRLSVSGNNGRINAEAPDTRKNFDAEMQRLRKEYHKPFFSFEVGQYEVLPDLHELEAFKGATRPDNLMIVKDRRDAFGISEEEWDKRVAATGEIALLAYREEVEAVLRTPEMSGISLLGLQDFTGQGTALVGMLNAHLRPKSYPFADSARFRAFFAPQTLLVLMDKYTYVAGEKFSAEVKFANYGKETVTGCLEYRLGDIATGSNKEEVVASVGNLTSLGIIELTLPVVEKAQALKLTVKFQDVTATYPLWLYPDCEPICPANVYETRVLDETARKVLQDGGTVYYSPDSTKEAIANSIKAQFTTDFWSVGTFPFQEGAMGQLIDSEHPIFRNFPTEGWTNWQWFYMASQRAFVLPRYIRTIIAEMDCYVSLRPMAQLYEAKCLNGRILASSMGLQNLQAHPEARALLDAIYSYLGSKQFAPEQRVEFEDIG